MSKKKKKKVAANRRSTAQVRKQKSVKHSSSTPNQHFIERPAISAVGTPKGFRAVSIGQGMIEYAKPVMEFVDKGVLKDTNDALQIAMLLWNFNISHENQDLKVTKNDIIRQIEEALKLNVREAVEFFNLMVKRKAYLLPVAIQPAFPMTVFIRQEKRYIISGFDYNSLNLSKEPYLPDGKDEKLVHSINQMDQYIAEKVDYLKWEDHYFSMEELCKERFERWLVFKGAKDYSKNFPLHIKIFLHFVYCYMHADVIYLKAVTPIYIEEFFADHLLRKVVAEPQDYIERLPALKLLYTFLHEIGYIENPDIIIKLFDLIEPHFIKILRDRY